MSRARRRLGGDQDLKKGGGGGYELTFINSKGLEPHLSLLQSRNMFRARVVFRFLLNDASDAMDVCLDVEDD